MYPQLSENANEQRRLGLAQRIIFRSRAPNRSKRCSEKGLLKNITWLFFRELRPGKIKTQRQMASSKENDVKTQGLSLIVTALSDGQ